MALSVPTVCKKIGGKVHAGKSSLLASTAEVISALKPIQRNGNDRRDSGLPLSPYPSIQKEHGDDRGWRQHIQQNYYLFDR